MSTTSAKLAISAIAYQTLASPYGGVGHVNVDMDELLVDGSTPSIHVDKVVQWTQVVPAAGNSDVDVRGKTQPDDTLFTPTKVVYWCIEAPTSNTAIVEVKGGAANGLEILKDVSDVLKIEPGGFAMGRCPTGVTCDATHKVLNVADAGTAGGTVTVTLWGV